MSILLAFFGFTLLSAGVVLTKAGSPWMKRNGRKESGFYRYLAIWLSGLLLYNLAMIPNGIASKTLPPHIVSAISGWGIIVIIILSYFFLKEKVFLSDLIYSIMIIAGIIILNVAEKPAEVEHLDKTAFYILLSIPFLILLPALIKNIGFKVKTVLFSIFAGCLGGFTLVIMNIVVKEHGYDIISYFSTPYPYLYMLAGFSAFIALQLAMRWGDMMVVGPLQNSFIIIYPVICSYFVSHSDLGVFQIAALVVIVYSCIAILKKH